MYRYILSFIAGRGALFLGPIFLANFMSAIDYGRIEAALASATLLSSLATLGTASLVPLTLLGHPTSARTLGIFAHHLLFSGISIAIAIFIWIFHGPSQWLYVAVIASGVSLQGLASIQLKTLGHSNGSVLTDAGLLGLMSISAVLAFLIAPNYAILFVIGAAAIYSLVLFAYYLKISCKDFARDANVEWLKTIQAGIPLMLGGIASALATTSGRLGMAVMAEPSMTANYSVLARAATLPIIAYQLIVVAKFRDIFTQPEAEVEKTSARILILVFVSAIVIMATAPYAGFLIGSFFEHALRNNRFEFNLILSQSIIWAAIALNDLQITRHQGMAKVLPYTAGFLALSLMAAFTSLPKPIPSLGPYITAHSIVMLAFYSTQTLIMLRIGIKSISIFATTCACYFLLIIGSNIFR